MLGVSLVSFIAIPVLSYANPVAAEFSYLATSADCAGSTNRSTAVKELRTLVRFVGSIDNLHFTKSSLFPLLSLSNISLTLPHVVSCNTITPHVGDPNDIRSCQYKME